MSANDALLIFVDARGAFEGWLHLRDNAIVARGAALEALPGLVDAETGERVGVAAIVPSEMVSIHWLEVPEGLAPAQAAAAARLMAAEVSAQPLADMHVAVGDAGEDSALRAVALVPALTMARWVGDLQAHGLDPDIVLPESLLLLPPAEGFVRHQRQGPALYRGFTDAFAIEPELADLIVAGKPVETIDNAAFEAGMADALAALPVNLRQGAFAKRRRWKIEWKLIRRLAMLGLAILAVTLAIQISAIMRYTFAADALEAEATGIAAEALPGARVSNGRAQLQQRLTQLRGSGVSYSAIASTVFGAVRDTANAELSAIIFDADGTLRVTVQGDSPATLAALQARIEADGLLVETGPMRSGGGRQIAEFTVRAR